MPPQERHELRRSSDEFDAHPHHRLKVAVLNEEKRRRDRQDTVFRGSA
jgi:hypothetical protein